MVQAEARKRKRKERDAESRLVSLYRSLQAKAWIPGAVAGWTEDQAAAMYCKLCDQGMKGDNLPLAAVAMEYLHKHKPDTIRGVMYSVVSAGWLPDTTEKSYDRVQRPLNSLRKKGVIPFDWIVDNIRSTLKPPSWSGLEDYADVVANCYRKNFWPSLPEYVEVIVEKDTVAGKVQPVTEEFDVRLHPLRGYCSTSFAWNIASHWRHIKKPITVYYVGDHDPSGRDIERSAIEALREYSGGKEFAWHRIAVNPEDFDQFDIIPLEPKEKDKRFKAFAAKYGRRCAEVEAIPANDLRDRLRAAIQSHIPAGQWERLQQLERTEKFQWHEVMKQIGGAL